MPSQMVGPMHTLIHITAGLFRHNIQWRHKGVGRRGSPFRGHPNKSAFFGWI